MQQPVLNGINQPCSLIIFLFKGQSSKKNPLVQGLEGFFQGLGFDQNTVRDLGKR